MESSLGGPIGFDQGDMEGVVAAPFDWEVQAYCCDCGSSEEVAGDDLGDGEGSMEFVVELSLKGGEFSGSFH